MSPSLGEESLEAAVKDWLSAPELVSWAQSVRVSFRNSLPYLEWQPLSRNVLTPVYPAQGP